MRNNRSAPPTASKVRQIESAKTVAKESTSPPAEPQSLRLEKEITEIRRAITASRQQLRNLQRDICSVHYNTQLKIDEISQTFTNAQHVAVAQLASIDAQNEALSEKLLDATKRLEFAATRVDQAVSIRATYEAECAVMKNAIGVAKTQLCELDAEVSDLDTAERDLREELTKLDVAKKTGVVNLEDARARNLIEEQELEIEESRLAASSHQLAVLRAKIADLKRAQTAVDTR